MKGVLFIFINKRSLTSAALTAAAAVFFAALSGIDGMGSYVQGDEPETPPAQTSPAAQQPHEETVVTVPERFAAQPVEAAQEDTAENSLTKGFRVVQNGETVGNVSPSAKSVIDSYISSILDTEASDGSVQSAQLISDITFEEGYFSAGELSGAKELIPKLQLDIRKTYIETELSPVESGYVSLYSDKVPVGSTVLDDPGQDGQLYTVYIVTEEGGEEVSRQTISETQVVQPVDAVILHGAWNPADLTPEQLELTNGFLFPLNDAECYVSSVFGYREFDDQFHNGVDYAAAMGTPVYSAAGGTVLFAGWDDTGFGNYVLIDHGNGYKTGYAHLSSITVSAGDEVETGSVVGCVGDTGYATGYHLHLVVKYNDQYTDPMAVFGE